jgi:hypothetical protein
MGVYARLSPKSEAMAMEHFRRRFGGGIMGASFEQDSTHLKKFGMGGDGE